MWLSTLLRKMTKGPDVGETFRDYIGCYMYGCEVQSSKQTQYLGAPASRAALESELRAYLQELLQSPGNAASPHLGAAADLLQALPQRLDAHLASDMQTHLAQWDDLALFVRKGVRQRRKEQGRFVE